MFSKKDLIKWLEVNIPEEAECFVDEEKDSFGALDIRIFDEHHDNKFYDYYFGL